MVDLPVSRVSDGGLDRAKSCARLDRAGEFLGLGSSMEATGSSTLALSLSKENSELVTSDTRSFLSMEVLSSSMEVLNLPPVVLSSAVVVPCLPSPSLTSCSEISSSSLLKVVPSSYVAIPTSSYVATSLLTLTENSRGESRGGDYPGASSLMAGLSSSASDSSTIVSSSSAVVPSLPDIGLGSFNARHDVHLCGGNGVMDEQGVRLVRERERFELVNEDPKSPLMISWTSLVASVDGVEEYGTNLVRTESGDEETTLFITDLSREEQRAGPTIAAGGVDTTLTLSMPPEIGSSLCNIVSGSLFAGASSSSVILPSSQRSMLEIHREYQQNMLLRAAPVEDSSSDASSSDASSSVEDSSSGSYEDSEEDDGVELSAEQNVVGVSAGERDDDVIHVQEDVACDEEIDICDGPNDVGFEEGDVAVVNDRDGPVGDSEQDIVAGDEQIGFADNNEMGGVANDDGRDENDVDRDDRDESDVDLDGEQDEFSGERVDVSGDDEIGNVASGDVASGDDRDDYDVDFSGEQDGFSGEYSDVGGDPGSIINDGECDVDESGNRLATTTDILKGVKRELVAALLAGSLDGHDDFNVYVKKKKTVVRRARERSRSFIGPLCSHSDPSESFPSVVDDEKIKWIQANCCRNGGIDMRIPEENERPWTVPDGWICVYDFWFTEYHLWFPLPRLLLAYCDEGHIALSQLNPAAIRNMVAALFTASEIGVHMSRRLIGIPLASVRSTSWRKMDLSEIPSLADCFAGGNDVATVAESGECSTGVEPSMPPPGIVMGLTSPTAPAPSTEHRRGGSNVSGKEVANGGRKTDGSRAGKGVANVNKRPAAGCSPKEAPSSKSRKIVPSGTELSLVVEQPLAVEPSPPREERATFGSFEYAFDGRGSQVGDLFKLFQPTDGVGGYAFDESRREEWYKEFARHTAIAAKFANKLVHNQGEELVQVKAELVGVKVELEKVKAELAVAKGKNDCSEEITIWRGKYEAEKKTSSAALGEVKKLTSRIASDAERAKKRQETDSDRHKKEKEVLSKKYRRAIVRHDDVLATCNSRFEKMRRYVENQKPVRLAMYGVNQCRGLLEAVDIWRTEGIQVPDSI
ncbi:hypothetical protein Bca52824_064122 [Brassica carinata]|uniref:Uncharacterized protein n=1 Tax=Brassica carinata TaxID=52824 RepID=A0A8X7U8C4_BRACI|nr:hypothetical protein Bca52824_064122 [Brassica carinata]